MAAVLYPSASAPAAAPAPSAAAGTPAAASAAPTDSRASQAGDDGSQASGDHDGAGAQAATTAMPKSFSEVRWVGEPPASSTVDYASFALTESTSGVHVVDVPMHDQALKAMQVAGLGVTQARAFYDMAVKAHAAGAPTTDRATAEAQLRATWGNSYDTKLASVKGLIDTAQAAWPGIRKYLADSGLGNNPAFLLAVARKARGD